ncbi:MAG: DUF4384 domain-containing protein [Acidobacteria bacterium]|nr:DUF4384 domain-containing protein [Acidobacteriota bacterium]
MSPAWLTVLLAALPGFSQTKTLIEGPHRMELTLERLDDSGWRVVDPGTVFNKSDRVRFRFRTNFDGYLYVMNQGTGGTYTQLFPREDTGAMNKIEAAAESLVPATDGAFRIDGPPGQDIVYWLILPAELAADRKYVPLPPAPPPSAKAMASLKPRCDDTILRARGECVDSSAGPKPVADSQKLPENIKQMAGDGSGELVFMKKQNKSVVSSPVPLGGPVVYEFRLAHK